MFSLKISNLFLSLSFSPSVSLLLYFSNFFSKALSYEMYFGFISQILSINLSIETFFTFPAFRFFSASSILNKNFWRFTVLYNSFRNLYSSLGISIVPSATFFLIFSLLNFSIKCFDNKNHILNLIRAFTFGIKFFIFIPFISYFFLIL